MKRIFLSIVFSICVFTFSIAQNLVKMWDKKMGGYGNEILTCAITTSDGGYLLGGYSTSSISGNKTQPTWGGYDYWIVKLDSLGNIQWDRDFGGSNYDMLNSVQQTTDGGYILAGCSKSGINGDKTDANWDATGMSWDYWIIKINAFGNKEWDKDFGGTGDDFALTTIQTSDGGYMAGGWSVSAIGGNKTEATCGNYDYWIVKTDSAGNKLWDKVFGGPYSEWLYSILGTTDGGFALGGWSDSDTGCNKSSTNWSGPGGGKDYWLVKIDSAGTKLWDKNYGGFDDDWFITMSHTSDNGFVMIGRTESGIGGDKTEPIWSFPYSDFWVVKVDSAGNKQWDKDFGGLDNEDELGNIIQTVDTGYLFAGASYSDIGGNKTENNLADEQTWIVKTDSLGNKIFDKTIFTNCHDEIGFAFQSSGGCYTVMNYNFSGCTAGGYKSEAPWNNSYDYWIAKFCDSTLIPPIASVNVVLSICPGTCTNFINQSLYAISYQWNFNGATPDTSTEINPTNICYQTPGSYDVQLIAINANGSDTLTLANYITVYPTPPPQSITQSGDTLFALTGSASYQWYFNTNIIVSATNYFYIATQSGNYSVVAADSNGCEVEAVMNNVIAENQLAVGNGQLTIFPNPVSETLDIHGLDLNSKHEISIFNLVGEKVFSAVNCKLPIANCQLSSGMYYIEITSDKKIFRMKFLKQ
jgi:hypothetical protein